MCKLQINTSCSVPLPLRVLKQPDSTQEASRKPPSFIPLISQGVVMPALPFANKLALSDHSYRSAITPWTSLIDISIPPHLCIDSVEDNIEYPPTHHSSHEHSRSQRSQSNHPSRHTQSHHSRSPHVYVRSLV